MYCGKYARPKASGLQGIHGKAAGVGDTVAAFVVVRDGFLANNANTFNLL